MKLIQHPTLKNFYLPDNGPRLLIFSTDTSKSEFLLAKAFVSYSFDFLIVFYKDAAITVDELLRQRLAKATQQLGRALVWIDQIGSTDINSCPSIQIESKNQASAFANISFGTDEHVIFLDNTEGGRPQKATVTYDDAKSVLVFTVNDNKKHRLVANNGSKSEYAAFSIPLSHLQELFGLNSRATTNNVGSICFRTVRSLANAVQPRTALLSPNAQNKNVLFSYQYFDDASYSQNTDVLGIIYPSVKFDNNATEFRSFIEVFIQEPLSTNFLDEFGNRYEIAPQSRPLVSRVAFVNGSPAGNPLKQNFFFAPVNGERLEMEAGGTQLLLGLSGTERQDRTKLEFIEYKNVLYTELLPSGEIKPSPHADSLTSIAISPKFLTDNDGLRYYIDSERTPFFDNENKVHTLIENTSREVPYGAARIGSISKEPEIPIIPTLSFSGNSNLKELEKVLVKRRLVNAVQRASVKAITPQGFRREGNQFDFIKNPRMRGLDAEDSAFHFTITNANLDFDLSIGKEDVFFATTPALLKDANFKDNFDIFFGINGFKIDLLLKNVKSPSNSEKIIIFKYSRHSVDELISDTSKWSNHGDFRKTDLSLVQKEIKRHFDRFEQKFDPSGKRNPDYLYIDQNIRRDPHWNGVFVLDIPIGKPENLPDIFKGLSSSQELDSYENPPKNPAPDAKRQFKTGLKFEYVAFPVNKTEINSAGMIDIKSTSFYGLVDYDVLDEPTGVDKQTVVDFFPTDPAKQEHYKFLLTKLLARFENSEIRNFKSIAFLQTPRLFEDEVDFEGTIITHDSSGSEKVKNLVRLEGSYQKNSAGADEFSFTAKGIVEFTFPAGGKIARILKKIAVNSLTFKAVAGGSYRFDVDVDAFFANFGVDVVFDISKINFKNIGLSFDLNAPGFPIPKFDLSSLGVFPDIKFDGKGFLSSFPIRLNSFQTFKFPRIKLPSGDFALALPELDFFKIKTQLPEVNAAWLKKNLFAQLFSFVFDIDLGTLGDIEALKALKGQFLIGWSFRGGFVIGFKLQGPSSRGLHLDLFGALKLDVKQIDMCQVDKTYFLRLIDARLTIFGKELPSKTDFDFNGVIYARPGDKIAWFFAATRKGQTGPPDNLVLGVGQRVGPPLDLADRTVSDVLKKVKKVFDEKIVPCNGGDSPVSKSFYNPGRNWLVASEDFIPKEWRDLFNLKFVFNDPVLYGINIEIANYIIVDVLYKKLSESLGVYSAELQLAPRLRNQDFDGINVTFPNLGIDVFTNGDFKCDIGFPRTSNDWSRSCLIQIRSTPPLVGWAGFYFTKLSTASLSLFAQYLSKLPKDPHVPGSKPGDGVNIIQAGFAFRVGIGAYIDKGIFYVGASISIYGIMEGAFGFNKSDGALINFIPDHFALRGRMGAIAELVGYVDFKIVKAAIYIILRVEFGLLLVVIKGAGLQPVPIYIEGEVRVEIDFTIACFSVFGCRTCIVIHLAFGAFVRFQYTLGGGDSKQTQLARPAVRALAATTIVVQLGEIPVVYVPSIVKTGEIGNVLVHQFAINLFGTKFENKRLKFPEKNILKDNIMLPIFSAILASGPHTYSTVRKVFLEGINGATNIVFNVSSYRPTIFAGRNDLTADMAFIQQHFYLTDAEFADFKALVAPNPCATGAPCPFRLIPAPISARIKVDAKNGTTFESDPGNGFKVKLSGLFTDDAGAETPITRQFKRSEEYSNDDIAEVETHFDDYMTQFLKRSNTRSLVVPPKDRDIREDAIIPEYFKLVGLLTLEAYFSFLAGKEENRQKENFDPPITLNTLFTNKDDWKLNDHLEDILGQLNYFYNNGLRLPDLQTPAPSAPYYHLLHQADSIRRLKQNPTPAKVEIVFSKHDGTLPIHLEDDLFAGTGLTDFVAKGREALSVNLPDINADFTNVGEQIPYRLLNVTLPISNSNINTDKGQFRFFEIPKKIYHEFKTQKAGLKLHIASNTKLQDDVINHMPCTNVEVSVRPHLIGGKLKCVELGNIFADDLNLLNKIKDEPDFIRKIQVYLKTVDNKQIVYLPLILAGEEKNTRLVKTNLSPRTHPPVIVAQTFRAFAVPNEKYVATLEDLELFARMLWEGVTTNDGGYFLFESDNSTLFAAIPPNAQEEIRLIFSFEAEIGKPFHSFSNYLKLSNDALGGRKIFQDLDKSTHSLYGAILFEKGNPVLEYHSKIPSHCFSFQLTRNKPAQQAISQYLPVEFSLLNKTTGKLILSRDAVLPLMPQHERNDDGSPVLNADRTLKTDLWIYNHVTPLVALTAEGSNRYSAVGQKFIVDFAVRDVFGFRALDLSKNVAYTHKYFDKLVPVNAWPFITTSYWFKEFKNMELIFELKIKAFEHGLKGIDKFALKQVRESLDTIIAQISDANVKISLNQGFTPQAPDLKAKLLNALTFVKQNLDAPKPSEFKLQFGLKVNSDLKTKLNPTIELKRDVADDLFVTISDDTSVWEYGSIKSIASEINLFNTIPDDSTIQLFNLAITTAAPAGCPYVVGLSSEEGERRSIYLLNEGFLQLKPKETLPLERTSYFAIKPYSNQLWSGSYKPITSGTTESTFSRVDLDDGLSVILSKTDALLYPETVKTLKRNQLEKLLFNKKRLVEGELQTKTANIDSPDERGQEELRKEFRDLLLENLGNFFSYDGIVSITPVSIGLGALKDHRISISLEKHPNYTLRSSKIDFRKPNPKWFVLFDQIQEFEFIDLDLQPCITHVEFDIQPDAASPEIERSTWIQLIEPIKLAPISTIRTVSDEKWPRISRDFPPVPLVLNHAAEQVTPDGGTLTWNKELGQWKYVISFLDRYKDLDRMNVELETTSFKRWRASGPLRTRNFKGFIAFWSTLILDERRKFVPDEFINDLDDQLALPAHDAENSVPLTQPNSFTIERQGGIWSQIGNATPYDVTVQKDRDAIKIVVGGKGFNLFDIGDRIKSITSKTTAFRNRRAHNDAFVYVTDTVKPATTATPHIAFFTPIRLRDGELLQSVYAVMKEMNLPYKSTAKLLVNVADLDTDRCVTLPVIPIRQMEFRAGFFPANTAFDTTFDRYRSGFPSISVTIYNAGGDLNDLPIFNAASIFTKVK